MALLPKTVHILKFEQFSKDIRIQSVGEQNPNHGQLWPRK